MTMTKEQQDEREATMLKRHGGGPVIELKDGALVPTPYHEGATEIGWAKVQSYLPAGYPKPDPENPPPELVDLCNDVGHEVLSHYDDPSTEPTETPVPPDWDPTVPYTFDNRLKKIMDERMAEMAKQAAPAAEPVAA